MADVVLAGVSKRFGTTSAVEGLDLEVKDGEFVVLLGPTGAGKTTTLRLTAGLELPDAGTIRIAGRDVTGLSPAARDVAFVFQQYSLYPHLSVFDNLAFPLRAPGRRWSEKAIHTRVTEIAGLLKIENKLQNRATRLSGGEMQRVAIGRALVRAPALYLMDEPLSSLDAKLREDLRIELKRIQLDLGASILYVTHDQIEALTLADRIGVLDRGRLVQVGTPRDVYERPATTYVARRLGSPAINLVPPGALPPAPMPAGTDRVGIRPEDVLIAANGAPPLRARITGVEPLGAETVLSLQIGEANLHALHAGLASPDLGDEVPVALRPGALLFFNRDGVRLADGMADPTQEAADV